jgi:hypothetical protein
MLRFSTRLPGFAPIIISFLLGCVECQAQAPTPEDLSQPTLPANTPVKLCLKQTISSKDAKPGQPVEFEVVEDVAVNGQVVIQRGATVTGSVRQVYLRGRGLKAAGLLVDLGGTQTVTGESVPLVGTTGAAGDADKMTAKDLPGMVAMAPEVIPVLPVALVMTLVPGKQFVLHAGMREMAHVQDSLALDPAKLRAAQVNVKKAGYATVFFSNMDSGWPHRHTAIFCGSVRLGHPAPLVVHLRPGQYTCSYEGYPTILEFEDGKEYFVSGQSFYDLYRNPFGGGDNLKEWNYENGRHALEKKIVDLTSTDPALFQQASGTGYQAELLDAIRAGGFRPRVRFGEREEQGDFVRYSGLLKRGKRDQVLYESDLLRIEADTLVYSRKDNSIEATGHVGFVDEKDRNHHAWQVSKIEVSFPDGQPQVKVSD